MVGKIFTLLFFIAILALGYYAYQLLPDDPVSLMVEQKPLLQEKIDYGITPVFEENLRFGKESISYSLDSSCSLQRMGLMREAFGIFETEMGVVAFYELNEPADIIVGCSNDHISLGENLYTAGEGGPSRIVNTSQFNVIQEGKISLYKESECDYPIVELHELGHVFGFDHSLDPKSIMYNISRCDQRITPDMVDVMVNLYAVNPLPELIIKEVTAVKRGRYLDFNITVINEGLTDSQGLDLVITDSSGKVFQEMDFDDLEVGFGRTLRAENVKLPTRGTNVVKFIIDPNDNIAEVNEFNNEVTLKVP